MRRAVSCASAVLVVTMSLVMSSGCGAVPVDDDGSSVQATTLTRRFEVLADGRTVRATRRIGGARLWQVNVFEACYGRDWTPEMPFVGEPRIRLLTVSREGTVDVVMGKHTFASLDADSGRLISHGSD